MPLAFSLFTANHGVDRGSHIIYPAWQSNNKQLRFSPIFVLLSHLSSPNENLCLSRLTTSLFLYVGAIADDEKNTNAS